MIKVLIVDDEYIMRQGLRYMINWEQEGYEIVGEATNGKDALALTEKLMPHIIISDIVMPLLDGVDFSDVVHRMFPHIQMIILSGYDNFEYVKHTFLNGVVDYILKPTLNPEELKNVLQKAASRIPGYKLSKETTTVSYERLMERYLLGHDKELDRDSFSELFHASYFRIYAVNIKKKNASGQDLSEIIYKKIKREIASINEVQKLMVFIREELVCVIFCYEMGKINRLLEEIQSLNDQLVILQESCFGVVSRPFHKLEEIRQIYQQDIIEYVDKGFYYQGLSLLIQEKNKAESKQTVPGRFDFFQYTKLLSSRQFSGALILLTQYCNDILEARMDVDRMKNQIKNMIYHYLDFLQITDEERENQRYQIFRDIENAAFEQEFQKVLEEVSSRLISLSGQNPSMNDQRIEKMLAYIAKNFQEDLNLEKLAEEFNFNYNYLSSFFNQQMKEGFSEYLNRVRVEKACELLKEKNLSIAAISSEVGYSDHSYFCRVFKKITGKPPSVWRREQFYE